MEKLRNKFKSFMDWLKDALGPDIKAEDYPDTGIEDRTGEIVDRFYGTQDGTKKPVVARVTGRARDKNEGITRGTSGVRDMNSGGARRQSGGITR